MAKKDIRTAVASPVESAPDTAPTPDAAAPEPALKKFHVSLRFNQPRVVEAANEYEALDKYKAEMGINWTNEKIVATPVTE